MIGRGPSQWITSALGVRLAVAAALSALIWLGVLWATGGGGGA